MTATSKSFKDLINGEKPVLVDFYATWCGPCKTLEPIVQETASRLSGKVKIIKVDVDKNPVAASTYQVRGVPTLILFDKGKIVWRQSGVLSTQQLTSVIESKLAG